jgi:hypothetical protein
MDVVVVGVADVVVASVVVEPLASDVVGVTTFAMAGSAVVLRITPATSEPIDPIRTERRGPRREVEGRPLGSPESFCPCVLLVMDQLSKTKSKVPPTTSQLPLNSIASSGSRYFSTAKCGQRIGNRHTPSATFGSFDGESRAKVDAVVLDEIRQICRSGDQRETVSL